MKIRITQAEIGQILLAAVTANIQFKSGSTPTIDFTATRGEDGIVAEIDVPYMGVGSLDLSVPTDSTKTQAPAPEAASPEPPQEPAPTKAPRAPRGSKLGSKALFGDLTGPANPGQDAAAEQAADGQEAAADEEAPPFPVTETAEAIEEAAAEPGTEVAAEQAETTPPPKGKSLFDN